MKKSWLKIDFLIGFCHLDDLTPPHTHNNQKDKCIADSLSYSITLNYLKTDINLCVIPHWPLKKMANTYCIFPLI